MCMSKVCKGWKCKTKRNRGQSCDNNEQCNNQCIDARLCKFKKRDNCVRFGQCQWVEGKCSRKPTMTSTAGTKYYNPVFCKTESSAFFTKTNDKGAVYQFDDNKNMYSGSKHNVCYKNKCSKIRQPNETCQVDDQCVGDLVCYEGRCKYAWNSRSEGESCYNHDECQKWIRCMVDAKEKCKNDKNPFECEEKYKHKEISDNTKVPGKCTRKKLGAKCYWDKARKAECGSGECRHRNDVKYGDSNLCGITNYSGNEGDGCVANWDCKSYMCRNVVGPKDHPNYTGKARYQCLPQLKLSKKCDEHINCESEKCWPNDHKEFGGHQYLCSYNGASRRPGQTCGRTVDCKEGKCLIPKKKVDGKLVDDKDREPVCTLLGTGQYCGNENHFWCASKECWHKHCLAGKNDTVSKGEKCSRDLTCKTGHCRYIEGNCSLESKETCGKHTYKDKDGTKYECEWAKVPSKRTKDVNFHYNSKPQNYYPGIEGCFKKDTECRPNTKKKYKKYKIRSHDGLRIIEGSESKYCPKNCKFFNNNSHDGHASLGGVQYVQDEKYKSRKHYGTEIGYCEKKDFNAFKYKNLKLKDQPTATIDGRKRGDPDKLPSSGDWPTGICDYKALGEKCYKDRECKTGVCTASTVGGSDNVCRNKRTLGQSCNANEFTAKCNWDADNKKNRYYEKDPLKRRDSLCYGEFYSNSGAEHCKFGHGHCIQNRCKFRWAKDCDGRCGRKKNETCTQDEECCCSLKCRNGKCVQLENGQAIGEVHSGCSKHKACKSGMAYWGHCVPCCDNFDDGHKACGSGKYCVKSAFGKPKCENKKAAGKPHGFTEIGYHHNKDSKRWCKSGYSAGGWCIKEKPRFKDECYNDAHCKKDRKKHLWCHGNRCKKREKWCFGACWWHYYM